jgi:DNA (cytosine-5)-methyltransferase 1
MVKVGKEKWRFGDGETRRMSWRETALIQTFPASLEFAGCLSSKHKQIGNAVPCKLAEAVARRLLVTLRR